MTIRVALILGLFLTGCGTLYKAPGVYDHVDFKAYTNAYLEYKEHYLDNDKVNYAIDIVYGHTESPAIATCERPIPDTLPYVTREIIIDMTWWSTADDEQRLWLIFHELGHCDLNCSHYDKELGLMNDSVGRSRVTDDMIERLFQECR